MNYDLKIFLLSILLFICLTIYDILITYNVCLKKNYKILFPMLLHRIITVFGYTGWLYKNKVILILFICFIFCILLHWLTNNGKCYLTQYENKICNFPYNRKYDILNNIFGESTQILFMLGTITYSIYKLTK